MVHQHFIPARHKDTIFTVYTCALIIGNDREVW
jgi:hypothetical protein